MTEDFVYKLRTKFWNQTIKTEHGERIKGVVYIYSSISDTYFENKKPVVSVIFLYNINTNGYN